MNLELMERRFSLWKSLLLVFGRSRKNPSLSLSICLVLFFGMSGKAQNIYSPIESARLNYTQVLFRGEAAENAVKYALFLEEADAKGLFSATSSIVRRTDSVPVFLVKNLHWGKSYRWHYTALDAKGIIVFQSKERAFSILKQEDLMLSPLQFLVKNPSRLKGYITWDGASCLTDRDGNVQWILPRSIRYQNRNLWDAIRDLRITPSGSFTGVFMNGEGVEIDRDGQIIWIGPNDGKISGDSTEHYHHELLKLANGHYLTLGQTSRKFALPENVSTSKYLGVEGISLENGKLFTSSPFSTIIEYDADGKALWYWRSQPFFNELYKQGFPPGPTHLNALYQDAAGENIYLSFRDLDEILKLNKASKTIVATFGKPTFDTLNAYETHPLFARQHSVDRLANGDLVTFNNGYESAANSSVVVFSQQSDAGMPCCPKHFEFSCKMDSLNNGKSGRLGNVDVLENGHLFVGMGMLGRAIELSIDDSKVLWDARCLKKTDASPVENYRSHFFESMYPYVFHAMLVGNAIRVFNRGDKADSYALRLMDKNNNLQQVFTTPEIPSGGHFTQSNLPHAHHVIVQSSHNPEGIQTLTLSK